MSIRALPIAALALLISAGAEAQSIPSPFRYIEETQSAGIFAGYVFTGRGDLDIGPHSGPMLGGTYTIRFAGPVSGEALLAGTSSRRTIYRRADDAAAGDSLVEVGETSAYLGLAHAGLKLHITGPRTWRDIAPYALTGIGFTTDLAPAPDEEEEIPTSQRVEFGPSFAVSVGAGTEWFPSERLAFRLEVRDFLWRVTTPPGLGGGGQDQTAWTQNIAVMLGAALYF